jgi:hypothetical protein
MCVAPFHPRQVWSPDRTGRKTASDRGRRCDDGWNAARAPHGPAIRPPGPQLPIAAQARQLRMESGSIFFSGDPTLSVRRHARPGASCLGAMPRQSRRLCARHRDRGRLIDIGRRRHRRAQCNEPRADGVGEGDRAPSFAQGGSPGLTGAAQHRLLRRAASIACCFSSADLPREAIGN